MLSHSLYSINQIARLFRAFTVDFNSWESSGTSSVRNSQNDYYLVWGSVQKSTLLTSNSPVELQIMLTSFVLQPLKVVTPLKQHLLPPLVWWLLYHSNHAITLQECYVVVEVSLKTSPCYGFSVSKTNKLLWSNKQYTEKSELDENFCWYSQPICVLHNEIHSINVFLN